MDIKKLKELLKFMDDNNLAELEVEEEGKRVKLRRDASGQPIIAPQFQASTPELKPEQPEAKSNTLEVKSPMVGTFYRASSPEVNPSVEVGQTIKTGDVVCIIEAMKLMNEIKAETEGKVTQILAENGSPVEFGQILFIIEPL